MELNGDQAEEADGNNISFAAIENMFVGTFSCIKVGSDEGAISCVHGENITVSFQINLFEFYYVFRNAESGRF